MSFTAVYSELMALDVDAGERLDRPPRILDREGWREEEWNGVPNMSASTIEKMAIIDDEDDYSDYPKRQWEVLKGFKTWKPRDVLERYDSVREAYLDLEDRTTILGLDYNMERCGIPYGGTGGVWKSLLIAVSEYTEPFAVYHSPYEHDFADVTYFSDEPRSVYYIEVVDGEVFVEEQTFERTGYETLVDDRERVADRYPNAEVDG